MPRIEAPTVAEHREAIWQRLRDGFLEALAEEGYAAVTLASVAKRAGIARNTVYNYADTKDALLVAVVERDIAPFVAELVELVRPVKEPEERLALIVSQSLGGALTPLTRSLHVSSSLEGALPADVNSALRRCLAPIFDLVAELVQQGAADGRFRPTGTVQRTVMRMVAVMQVSHSFVAEGKATGTIAKETTQFFLSGLGFAAASRPRRSARRRPSRR